MEVPSEQLSLADCFDSCWRLTTPSICQVAAVHLVDAHHCSDPAKFISVLLVSLSTMVRALVPCVRGAVVSNRVRAVCVRVPACVQCHLELPHVNVLSKVDLVQQFGQLAFGLDFYTDVLDLEYLLEHLKEVSIA